MSDSIDEISDQLQEHGASDEQEKIALLCLRELFLGMIDRIDPILIAKGDGEPPLLLKLHAPDKKPK